MKLKSNAKYGQPWEEGTIFTVEIGRLRVVIHQIVHLKGWYLSCKNLMINDMPLKAESLAEAFTEAQEVVGMEVEGLRAEVSEFLEYKYAGERLYKD